MGEVERKQLDDNFFTRHKMYYSFVVDDNFADDTTLFGTIWEQFLS
jgi:hypothetical protein